MDMLVQDEVQGNLAMTNSSSSSREIVPCSTGHLPPMIINNHLQRPDQALKCPRCNSTQTKFCYYNNYSLSQPRYFCKTCRRYWTKGGSLRNIPIGGGCRKNKQSGSSGGKKPSGVDHPPFLHQYNSFNLSPFAEYNTLANLHLPSHLGSLLGSGFDGSGSSYRYMPSVAFHQIPPPAAMSFPIDQNDMSSATVGKDLLSMEWQESSCNDVGRLSSLGYCSTGTGNEYHGTNTFHI